MANYLPVLLVSVSTNAIPDDSSLSTLPTAQVDYLSHEWQEEDVWKSWRNMTKQKKEIANGVRLENASWRTWWKQRNKLKTVTPETLNWLKDSDVTWLYGPLHTAVDWFPPSRPPPCSSNADADSHPNANSPQPTPLDLESPSLNPKHKPILKHRSISELLTSDLPASPLFSPAESEEEDNGQSEPSLQHLAVNDFTDNDALADPDSFPHATLSRPRLMHTKSDTHVTRWGPSRAFRKDSPPRFVSNSLNTGDGADSEAVSATSQSPSGSGSHAEGSDTPLHHSGNATGSHPHVAIPFARYDEPQSALSTASGTGFHQKKKHISFNTYVEQCIAIDKPKSESPRPFERTGSIYGHGWEYDEGYDEDDEDGFSGVCAIESDSDSDYNPDDRRIYDTSESAIDDEDEDEEDEDILHIRTPSPKYNPIRSTSKSSVRSSTSVDTNASISTSVSNSTASTSSSSSSSSTSRRIPRRNSAPTRRRASLGLPTGPALFDSHQRLHAAPMIRGTSDSSSTSGPSEKQLGKDREHPIHVTIAPIAPTFLKTSSLGEEESVEEGYPWSGFGFDNDFGYGCDPFGWGSMHGGRVAGGGQVPENGSTGAWSAPGAGGNMKRTQQEDGYIPRAVRAETPVELVYAPRVGNGYNVRYENPEIVHREDVNADSAPSPRRRAQFSVGDPDDLVEDYQSPPELVGRVTVTPASPTHSPSSSVTLSATSRVYTNDNGVPTPPAIQVGGNGVDGDDPYDYFGGPDLGEDFSSTSSGRRWTKKPQPPQKVAPPEEDERGRERERSRSRSRSNSRSNSASLSVSRSRSRSRTPSPSLVSANTSSSTSPEQTLNARQNKSPSASPGISPVNLPKRSGSFELRQTSPPAMLSPPLRGRSIGGAGSGESRGRSITRTPSSSFSDRERSSCQSSPIGSSSPEGSSIGLSGTAIYGVYANGRVGVERDRDAKGTERQRGRPRIGRNLSSSTSVSPVDSSARDAGTPSLVEAALAAAASSASSAGPSPSTLKEFNSAQSGLWPKASTSSSSSSSSTISEASSVATVKPPTSDQTVSVPIPSASQGMVPKEQGCSESDRSAVELEGPTTLGRAAGMLSSYLALWPAAGTA
ncbi:protein phosphatase regulator [Pleurotus ostreatus]|nr:protein phosphatase regulator [Pleurotus ostreatus]